MESPILLSLAGSNGGYGDVNAGNMPHASDISSYGTAADGIFAQGLGGKNLAGVSLGVGGAAIITVTGAITAHSKNSSGIPAQSTVVNSSGNIAANGLGSNTVYGGSGSNAAGVRIEGGVNNTLTNFGTITTLNGDTVVGIRGGNGSEFVANYGPLDGWVLLGEGINLWNNHSGSVFNMEAAFALGISNAFENRGLVNGNGQFIGNVVSGGAISPGNSAGSRTIAGSLNLLAPAITASFQVSLDRNQFTVVRSPLRLSHLASLCWLKSPVPGNTVIDVRKPTECEIAKVHGVTSLPLSQIKGSDHCHSGTQFRLSLCQFRASQVAGFAVSCISERAKLCYSKTRWTNIHSQPSCATAPQWRSVRLIAGTM